VVNLSLGAELPLAERFAPRWFPHTSKNARGGYAAPAAAIADFRELIHLNMREAIAWVIEQGALVVAAVGNDYYISPIGAKEPRYPAAYDSVLGVASVKANDAAADYSNLGDERVPLLLNGVATFGGNATLPGGLSGNGPAVTDDAPNAVKGIFSAKTLPLNGGPNSTGWVEWAGTSFATPIISAIAAHVWAEDLDGTGVLDYAGVTNKVRGLHPPGSVGAVPVVEAQVV
jgi:subtilisin family serine protease